MANKTETARRTAQGIFQTWEDRKTLVKQILARQNEQAPGILLFEPQGLDGLSAKVENYEQPNAQMSYSRMNVRN